MFFFGNLLPLPLLSLLIILVLAFYHWHLSVSFELLMRILFATVSYVLAITLSSPSFIMSMLAKFSYMKQLCAGLAVDLNSI